MSWIFVASPIFKYSILGPNYLNLSKNRASYTVATHLSRLPVISLSLFQIHPFLPCFIILERDRANISLPTHTMLVFVGRGCWRNCGGGSGFSSSWSWFLCALLIAPAMCSGQHVGHQMALTPSRFQWPSEGSCPEKAAGTQGVPSCSLWYLPNFSTITWVTAVPSPVRPGSQLWGEEGTCSRIYPSLKCSASALGVVITPIVYSSYILWSPLYSSVVKSLSKLIILYIKLSCPSTMWFLFLNEIPTNAGRNLKSDITPGSAFVADNLLWEISSASFLNSGSILCLGNKNP